MLNSVVLPILRPVVQSIFDGLRPQPSPSLSLNFLTSGSLDPRITFTRATTATFTGSNGLIQSAAINAPRFDYSPTTLAPLGLLIEEQRTNLLTYSSDLSTGWTKGTAATWALNSGVAPDGTMTALGGNNISGTSRVSTGAALYVGGPAITGGSIITLSVYVRAKTGTASEVCLRINETNGNNTVGPGNTIGTAWQRISLTVTTAAGATAAGVTIGTITGTADLFIWGAQLEVGAFTTSYIPTVASQVTRAADIAVMTGTNFSSWYNASQGTFVAAYEASPNPFTTYLVASNGVTAQNSFHFDNGGGNMRAVYYSGSSAVAILSLGTVGTAGTINKVASAYQVNNFAASRNAGIVVIDTAGAVPASLTQLNIGADPSGAAVNVMNTHIRQIAYYSRRLSNTELQGITS